MSAICKGTLYAIKLTDGSILWQFAGPAQIFAAPAKRGGTIYFTSRNGLTALSQDDGRVIWQCKLVADATESSPLIVKDRIIVADSSGNVTAVDFDGKLIWQHDIAEDAPPRPSVSTPIAHGWAGQPLDPGQPQATGWRSSSRSSTNPGSSSLTSRRADAGGRSRRRAGSGANRP